jgi:hypothetical protein
MKYVLLAFFILACKFICWLLSSLSVTAGYLKFASLSNLQFFNFNCPLLFRFKLFSFPLSFIFLLVYLLAYLSGSIFHFYKTFRISMSFFHINTKPSAFANIFNCSLLFFIPLGTIFILFITICNAELNNIGDNHSLSVLFYFRRKITMLLLF